MVPVVMVVSARAEEIGPPVTASAVVISVVMLAVMMVVSAQSVVVAVILCLKLCAFDIDVHDCGD